MWSDLTPPLSGAPEWPERRWWLCCMDIMSIYQRSKEPVRAARHEKAECFAVLCGPSE
jgi:hypothetical protein